MEVLCSSRYFYELVSELSMLSIVNLVFSKSSDALCYMYLFKFHIVLPPAADTLSLSLIVFMIYSTPPKTSYLF